MWQGDSCMSNFKKAILTTVLFILVLAAFHIPIFACLLENENFHYQDYREREALSGTLDYVVVGSSHAMWAINPKILDEKLGVNSYNLSNEWLNVKSRYTLLEYEIRRNPIKTVIYEVSYDTLRTGDIMGDEYALTRWSTIPERIRFFIHHIKPKDYLNVYQFLFTQGVECAGYVLDGTNSKTIPNPDMYKGYFRRLDYDVTADYAAIYNTDPLEFEVVDESMEYMQKTVDLCKENGIEIILVNVPNSRAMICRRTNLDLYREIYQEFADENDLIFVDFNLLKTKDEVFPDKYAYFNEEHLAGRYANFYTAFMVDTIARIESGEDLSDEFFDSYEAYEMIQDYYPQEKEKAQ